MTPPDLFALIRTRCAEVAAQARLVRLQSERLEKYAASLVTIAAEEATLDESCHYLGHGEDTILFLIALDSINFGSGYFPHLHKLPGLSGYFTVATRLTEHFRQHGPLTPAQMTELTPERCAAIFRQDLDHPARAALMALFARALADLGALLAEYEGRASNLVAAAGGRAETLVQLLARMPFFRDVERYDTFDVPFYKRAQITAADLAVAFHGEGPGTFSDLNQLTIFADNLVPHVLRVDGILAYDPDLAAAIDAGQLIPAGSPAEIEIRAVALHAVEQLSAILAAQGHAVPPMRLDYLLWNRGQGPSYKAIPRHRTRTVFY